MLRQALENQKQEANKLNESAIEYSLLKRDVESYRTLYEGLMEKLRKPGSPRDSAPTIFAVWILPGSPPPRPSPTCREILPSRWPSAFPPELGWHSCWKASTTPCELRNRPKPFPPCHRWA